MIPRRACRPRRFTIATGERVPPRRWFWVQVHRDAQDLQEAAYRLHPGAGRDFWTDVEGCCQAVMGSQDGGRSGFPANGYAGIIRFNAQTLTPDVLAHELVHAAAAVFRMNVRADMRLGPWVGEREEQLAYLHGELFQSLTEQLLAAR